MFARLVACGVLAITACQVERPTGVGVRTEHFAEGPLNDTPPIEIWYPAAEGSQATSASYAGLYESHAARDAPPRPGGPWPLVVLSHGHSGSRFDLGWLAEALAARGMIVASLDHSGSTMQHYDPALGPKLWVRAASANDVIDDLLADPQWGPHIDARRIAAAGYSMGGSTVLLMGGAYVDPILFAMRYPMAGAGDATSVRDARLRAVVSIAPGTGPAFTSEGIRDVRVPTLIISGSSDDEAPEDEDASVFAANIADRTWWRIVGASHGDFRGRCTLYAHLRHRHICGRPWAAKVDAHAEVIPLVEAFLAQALR